VGMEVHIMERIEKIVAILIIMLLFVSVFGSVNSIKTGENIIKNENSVLNVGGEPSIEITYPKLGYLCAFGGNIPIGFLGIIGWGIVINSELCVETITSGSIDYVVFNVTSPQGGLEDTQIDYDHPFECCFNSSLPRWFFYDITATAYYDGLVCGEDEVGTIAYIKTGGAPPTMGTLVLQITDDPPELNITKALVTISQVKVQKSAADDDPDAGWYTIVEEPQTFDLIAIQDVKEFFGSENLSTGWYTQIRLYVDEALVTIDGIEYNLTIPSKMVELIIPFQIEEDDTTTLTLDFDVKKSVFAAGEGVYIMNPVIKVIQE